MEGEDFGPIWKSRGWAGYDRNPPGVSSEMSGADGRRAPRRPGSELPSFGRAVWKRARAKHGPRSARRSKDRKAAELARRIV
mgnify:CR=1 FL=1